MLRWIVVILRLDGKSNALLGDGRHLKIADWGLARRLYEMQDKYGLATSDHVAPDIIVF